MGSKAIIFIGFSLAMILLIANNVAARELAETSLHARRNVLGIGSAIRSFMSATGKGTTGIGKGTAKFVPLRKTPFQKPRYAAPVNKKLFREEVEDGVDYAEWRRKCCIDKTGNEQDCQNVGRKLHYTCKV